MIVVPRHRIARSADYSCNAIKAKKVRNKGQSGNSVDSHILVTKITRNYQFRQPMLFCFAYIAQAVLIE